MLFIVRAAIWSFNLRRRDRCNTCLDDDRGDQGPLGTEESSWKTNNQPLAVPLSRLVRPGKPGAVQAPGNRANESTGDLG